MSSNISNSKSSYVTSPQGYRDMDGHARNFDMIDYSPKTKISGYVSRIKKEEKIIEVSIEEELCLEIYHSHINEKKEFIVEYDKLLKEFGAERFKKGKTVEFKNLYEVSSIYKENGWFNRLKGIYESNK